MTESMKTDDLRGIMKMTNNDEASLDADNNYGSRNDDDDDDDDSSVHGSDGQHSSPDEHMSPRARAAMRERQSLSKKETYVLSGLRFYLWAFLAVAAGLLGWGTYKYTSATETDEFESRFASIALSVSDSFVDGVERKLGALDALSVSITSHALQSGEEFPAVTLPDYEVQAGNTRILADGVYVFWLPYVRDEQRGAWEQYAGQNYQHLYGAFANEMMLRTVQDQQFGYGTRRRAEESSSFEVTAADAAASSAGTITDWMQSRNLQDAAFQEYIPTIWNFQGPEQPGNGPFFPLWQMSPVLPLAGLLNFNFVAFEGDGILNEVAKSELAVVGGVALNLTDAETTGSSTSGTTEEDSAPMTTEELVSAYLSMGQYRHDAASFQSDPLTPVAYPVFSGWGPQKNFTGALYTSVYWRLLFQDILPGDVKGVICVLRNTGGFAEGGGDDPPFSFRLDGPDATFLGVGDLHDSKYNDMRMTYDVVQSIKERASPLSRSYTTAPLNAEYNTYILDIYPSQDMEDDYVTNEPYLFMAVIVGVFLFVLLSFVVYDCVVERRQKAVLDRAVKSGTLVSTLFPEGVRDQLYKEMDKDLKKKKKGKEWEVSEELSKSIEMMVNSDDDEEIPTIKKRKERVIAQKYPETTVFFMDLAGFTQWSSQREPEDVFLLLETLYGAYDAIAIKRNVFKVETIGDCYMACCGLPEPQADHAYRLAKFAIHCLSKTALLLHQLKEKLGEDTVSLDCRIGLHSGPVTAGVLRGDRGRFQLFGDTVNTASRMESTGEPGRIHCSQDTADLLVAAGKSHWLTPREDKIVAKGKGEMTTYWIQARGGRGTMSIGASSNGGGGTTSSGGGGGGGSSKAGGLHRRMYPQDLSVTDYDESERGGGIVSSSHHQRSQPRGKGTTLHSIPSTRISSHDMSESEGAAF